MASSLSSKKRTKTSQQVNSQVEFVRSFFGRNVGLKKSFRICLTFTRCLHTAATQNFVLLEILCQITAAWFFVITRLLKAQLPYLIENFTSNQSSMICNCWIYWNFKVKKKWTNSGRLDMADGSWAFVSVFHMKI